MNSTFWHALDILVQTHPIHIDRPAHSAHPRFPDIFYPFDYGYLDGTTSEDGSGIDVWRGSQVDDNVTAMVCTVDLFKQDAEIKLLLGCDSAECERIHAFHNINSQHALLIKRPEQQETQ
ncbi:MAG: inorganic pyrophosphatase [Anaerolineae bacterium]|nr:inorganic pyrophosphatase [Anaerolineae bacterium]MCO5204358.1 inorganic pyrophosphatase [Anaerolineae bacterium]